MGTGSKSSHASYAVGTTTASEADEVLAEAPAQPMSDEEVLAKADLLMAMNLMGEIADPPVVLDIDEEVPTDPVERYDVFVGQVEQAQEAIEKLKEAGAPEEEIEAHIKALKAQTLAYLNSLDEEDLREIAAAKGFEHPALVGMSGKGQHALVHWLDPAYPQNIPSKAKIQAAALNRYNELLAGKTVGGMTLAELHEIEGTEPPASPGSWKATPGEVAAAAQAVTESVDAWEKAAKDFGPQWQEKLTEVLPLVLAAEQKLASADCPELGEDLTKVKAQAKAAIDDALGYVPPTVIQPLVQEALASGQLNETEANHLSGEHLLALMRPDTPDSEVESLKALAAQRQEQLENLDTSYAAHIAVAPGSGQPLNLPPAGDPGAPQAIAAWAKNAGDVRTMQTKVNGWYAWTQQAASDTPYAEHPALGGSGYLQPAELTSDFKAWAKEQKLSDLRAVAAEMGMDNHAQATRAHVQNYIAAAFNPEYNQQAIKDKVAADAAKKEAAKAAKAAPATTPEAKSHAGLASDEAVQALASKLSSNGTSAKVEPVTLAAKPVKTPKPGSFNANVQALMAAVQHAKATHQDLPARVDAKEVASWNFGSGTPASNLGGTYAKTLHAAPDGSQWLFKADHNHGGALGHTEAAASHMLSLGGVPTVPVYHHKKADGTAGSIQPLLKDAKPFTASPSQWTQAQVDAIVRSHVGSWLVGEHDGHQSNWLSTPSGGLVQIDRGQAFKHYGLDKLAVDYAPSGGGEFTPVHQKLYQAALGGGLANGVEINPAAAHPVIKKLESVPDAQLRSILHSTAHEGVKAGVAWVPQMRSRAAKTLKIPQSQVTQDQIASAFLDHAVERKNTLRQSFSDFFVKQLGLPSGASLKHGGS